MNSENNYKPFSEWLRTLKDVYWAIHSEPFELTEEILIKLKEYYVDGMSPEEALVRLTLKNKY